MLICLLLFEICLVSLIVLTHCMVGEKYKEIEKGISLYTSKRAYKTEASIAFVDQIIKKYKQIVENGLELSDLDSMIKSSLLKENIGHFTYIGVCNVAQKSKYVMWGIIVLQMFIGYINGVLTSLQGISVIITSILLTLGMEIFNVVDALEEKKEATIVLVEDYVVNTYPLDIKFINDKKDLKQNDLSSEVHILQEKHLSDNTPYDIRVKKKEKTKMQSTIEMQESIEKKEKVVKQEKIDDQVVSVIKEKKLTEKDIARFIKVLQ